SAWRGLRLLGSVRARTARALPAASPRGLVARRVRGPGAARGGSRPAHARPDAARSDLRRDADAPERRLRVAGLPQAVAPAARAEADRLDRLGAALRAAVAQSGAGRPATGLSP